MQRVEVILVELGMVGTEQKGLWVSDPTSDAFYARFAPVSTPVAETREVAPGVMLDLDSDGHLVGIEILYVSVRERRDDGF